MTTATFSVGDRVGVYRMHSGDIINASFGVVAKIDGRGWTVLEDGRKFDRDGKRRMPGQVRGWNADRLCDAEWLQAKLDEKAAANRKHRTVQDLILYLEGRRTGCGNYVIEARHKEELIRLVNEL